MKDRKASKSAEGVVGWLADRARDPRVEALLPAAWSGAAREVLSGARGKPVSAPGAFRHRWLDVYERFWVPGVTVHLALRKRFVDTEVRRALAEGAEQLVVLGAGLDPLASRIATELPECACVEVDHPASHAVKKEALAGDDGESTRLPTLVPVDLMRESLSDALGSMGPTAFRPGAPTVFVAEGLLMYLGATRVDALFADITALAGPGSRLVFTFAEGDEHGRPQIRRFGLLQRLHLALAGEPLHWCPSRAEVDALLERHVLEVMESCADGQRRELLGEFRARETVDPFGEVFVVASVVDGSALASPA